MKEGKNLTVSDELIAEALKHAVYDVDFLKTIIKDITKENREVDTKIQKIKFAIILGNQWFQEFDSRENCSMEIDGVNFSIELKEKMVKI